MNDKQGRRERTGKNGEAVAGGFNRDIGASLDKLKLVESHWQQVQSKDARVLGRRLRSRERSRK